MLKLLKNIFIAFGITLLLGLFMTFIITILVEKEIITPKVNDYLIYGIATIAFFLFGLLFARKQKSKAFWWALLILGFYLAITLSVRSGTGSLSKIDGIFIGVKSLALLCGTMLGLQSFSKRELSNA